MSLWCPKQASVSGVHHAAHPRFSLSIAALALTIASGFAVAAEWSAEPTVSLRQEYNDNINLTLQPHNAVWGTILSPAITFSGNSETLEVSGGAQLNFNRYTGAKGLDSDDRIFTLSTHYKTERDKFGLNVSSKSDSTRATELASTGSVLPRAQRNSLSIRPSWTHSLTERVALRLDYTLSDTKYEDGASVGLVDSKYKAASASVIYLLTATDKLTVSGTRSKSISTGSSESTTDDLRLGLTHEFSETLQADAQVGVRRTTSTFLSAIYSCDFLGLGSILPVQSASVFYCAVPNYPFPGYTAYYTAQLLFSPQTISTRGSVLNLGLSKKFGETGSLTARLSRDINPNGRGLLIETDHLSLGYSKRFSETLSGLINTNLYRYRYPSITNSGGQYFTIAPTLSWQLSEWWTMDAGVQYANQKSNGAATSVSSNLIYGSIRYNWPKMSVSR